MQGSARWSRDRNSRLRWEDRDAVLVIIARRSAQSLYRHFFRSEAQFFLNVDFVTHVPLVGVRSPSPFVDEHQGRGIGKILLGHFCSIGRVPELRKSSRTVLPQNEAMGVCSTARVVFRL